MKTVFLTGSSGGLGLYLATSLLEQDYFVILHYFQHKEKLIPFHKKYPEKTKLIKCDLRKETEVKQMKENLKIPIDILINNAAIDHTSELEEKNEETFLDVLKVNTLGPFFMMKYFGEEINNRKGSIVNISSDNTIDQYDIVSLEYDVSKVGLNQLTKSFAKYYPKAKINAICFGWLDTPMNKIPEELKKEIPFVPFSVATKSVLEEIDSKETGKIKVVR